MKQKIIFVNSHPIQYFAPMYKYMNDVGLETHAWYCTEGAVKGKIDKQFGVEIKWDIPLLDGYSYKYFKNQSWKPSNFNGFFGLINLGLVAELFKVDKSVIVVHGWHYLTHFLVLMLGKLKGHTVCIRCDVPQNHEVLKKGWKQDIKHLAFKYILFPRISYFLYVGQQNRAFYKSYGIPDERLISSPYAVDNARFQAESNRLAPFVSSIKNRMSIPLDHKIILFAAKYIDKKRPLDLLEAFWKLGLVNSTLIMVGEGELRNEMELFIKKNKIDNIILTGFVNQSQISEYYAIADLFVMCSAMGENWGLSVNEAMNFNLPLVLSDLTGCANDLVDEGVNGFVFKTGDVDALALKLKDVLINNKLTNDNSSLKIIDQYSFQVVVDNLRLITN